MLFIDRQNVVHRQTKCCSYPLAKLTLPTGTEPLKGILKKYYKKYYKKYFKKRSEFVHEFDTHTS